MESVNKKELCVRIRSFGETIVKVLQLTKKGSKKLTS